VYGECLPISEKISNSSGVVISASRLPPIEQKRNLSIWFFTLSVCSCVHRGLLLSCHSIDTDLNVSASIAFLIACCFFSAEAQKKKPRKNGAFLYCIMLFDW
jgi:hypothetical protein